MDELELKKKIIEWLSLRKEVEALVKAVKPDLKLVPPPPAEPAAPAPKKRNYMQQILDEVRSKKRLTGEPGGSLDYSKFRGVQPPGGKKIIQGNRMKPKTGIAVGSPKSNKVFDPDLSGTAPRPKLTKDMQVGPAGVNEPMLQNRVDFNEPKTINSPNTMNPYRNIVKSLKARKGQE